ncbi:MAG: type II toxin-antitoxin system HicB family antitoxin [Bacteroidetes bacterium]|nr:type II toxin-antitoxin system HicB family antitoxin [Bacteroidota bacterium]MDA1120378.1 type II toxin-antitoxin system HicB family antitoxin [Bacteroidota bacterium]
MRRFLVILEKTSTGYSAYSPDVPGCIATGSTKRIAEKNIYDAIQFHLEGLKDEKLELPTSSTEAEVMVFN